MIINLSDRRGNARASGQITSNFLTQASWRLIEIRQPPTSLCTTSNSLVFNLQLPHITSNLLMAAMVIMVTIVMVLMMMLVVIVVMVMVVVVDMVVLVDGTGWDDVFIIYRVKQYHLILTKYYQVPTIGASY